ncbi:unnamed protein product [Rhizophagus irregularis]|nr:unnamed protein product [Rhizophagus irregularis]
MIHPSMNHVATGKYFRRYVQYKTGSKRSIVFTSLALSNSNSLWILDQNNNRNPIIYGKTSYDIESDSTNNNDTYIKSKEIINIRDMEYNNYILRSHEFPDNETYQDVVGHKGRVDEHDKWCIE